MVLGTCQLLQNKGLNSQCLAFILAEISSWTVLGSRGSSLSGSPLKPLAMSLLSAFLISMQFNSSFPFFHCPQNVCPWKSLLNATLKRRGAPFVPGKERTLSFSPGKKIVLFLQRQESHSFCTSDRSCSREHQLKVNVLEGPSILLIINAWA